jgi:ribosomal protein S18 acetylase RimI-like enzyme
MVQKAAAYLVTPAGPGDALALAQVHVRAWRETYPGILPQTYLDRMSAEAHAARWVWRLLHAEEITLAAEGPDGLVGYASGDVPRLGGGVNADAEITTLYVLRRAQGEGVGRRLMTGLARTLAAKGAESLVIWVLRDNLRARGFYEAMGGVLTGERTERVGGWNVPSVAYRWADVGAIG